MNKDKTPNATFNSATNRVVGGNRLFGRDVLLSAEPRREAKVRTSIIGDKKLSAQDAFEQRLNSDRNEVLEKKFHQESSSTLTSRRSAEFDDPIFKSKENSIRRESGYNSVSPQKKTRTKNNVGAVDEVRAKVTRILIYRGTGLMLLLITFASIAYFASEPLTHLLERPLKSVAVEGQFQYLPKDRAMELIAAEIDGDFLRLNLDRLKNVLQNDPWVERVSLSRQWPDTLVVKITEQQPIARWDANGFLNQRGEIVRVNETSKLLGLPWLQGNENNTHEIMQQYQDISTLLRSRGLEIIALRCDNKKSWRITLKNDVEIAIGRDQVMEKLRKFVTVYDNFLSSIWLDVKAIDVRYTNGVSVSWVPDSESAKKYLKLESLVKK